MILTIAIPVLNEIKHLPTTIDSIFREARFITESIEVLVIDNASRDGTSQYLDTLMKSRNIPGNVALRILQNTENMGFDNSFENLVRFSTGEFFWPLGAQEKLLPFALKNVVVKLHENPWFLVLNTTVWDEATDLEIWDNMYKRYQDEIFYSPEDFFQKLGGPALSLSANISRRLPLLESLNEPTFSRYWSWLERFMDVLKKPAQHSEILFISTPVIQILVETQGWQRSGEDRTSSFVIVKAHPMYFTSVELSEIAIRKYKDSPVIRNSIGVFRSPFECIPTIANAKADGMRATWPTIRNQLKVAQTVVHFLRRITNTPAKHLGT